MARIVLNVTPQADADGICASQTPNSGGSQALTLNGALASNGSVTFESPHKIVLTSAGNDSSRTFTIVGTDVRGISMIETRAGGNATAVESVEYFKTVESVTIDDNSAGAITVGVNGKSTSNWGVMDTTGVSVGFGCVLSSDGNLTYEIQHTFDDIQDIDTTDFTWFTHEMVSAKTDNQDGNYAFGCSCVRAVVTSFTAGTLKTTLIGAER